MHLDPTLNPPDTGPKAKVHRRKERRRVVRVQLYSTSTSTTIRSQLISIAHPDRNACSALDSACGGGLTLGRLINVVIWGLHCLQAASQGKLGPLRGPRRAPPR